MIDARLLVPATAAWLGAVLTIVGADLAGDLESKHAVTLWLGLLGLALVVVAVILGAVMTTTSVTQIIVTASLGLALGICSASGHVWALTASPVSTWIDASATATVEGVVTGEPVTLQLTGAAIWQASTATQVRIATSWVQARGERVLVDLPMSMRVPGSTRVPPPGSRVRVAGRLSRARSPDTAATLQLSASSVIAVVDRPGVIDVAASAMRQGLRSSLEGSSEDAASLVAGLAVGDESMQSAELDTAMRMSGLSHLTAVSGGNVAIILLVVLGIGRLLCWRLPTRVLVGLLALGYFVVLVRPQPSVVRAAIMGVVLLLALLSGGRRSGPAVLATAVLLVVVLSPVLACSWAFALSVFATAGLILLAPAVADRLSSMRLTRRWPPALQEGVAIATAAQLATLPLLLAMGAGVGWVAIPANLLAMPAVAPVTILGLLAAMVAPVSLTVASVIAHVAAWPAAWIAGVAHVCSALPLARMPWPTGWIGVLLLIPAGLICWLVHHVLVRRYPQGVPAKALASIAAVLAVLSVTVMIAPPGRRGWPPPAWIMVMCDVGQGDGIVVNAGDGTAIVVDAGPDPVAMDGCLADLGIWAVSAVILTHFHADHVNGLPGVLRGRTIGAVFVSPVADPPEEVALVDGWLRDADLRAERARVGEVLTVGAVSWRVLWPSRRITAGSIPNNASVVVVMDVDGTTLLLSGDMEAEAQSAVIASEPGLEVDVVKVAHHGSRNQDPDLPEWSHARIALVSVGVGNTYGHPAPETLAEWGSAGALIGRTDESGDLAVTRDESGSLGLVTRGR